MTKENGEQVEIIGQLMHNGSNHLAAALSQLRKLRQLATRENPGILAAIDQLGIKLDEFTTTHRAVKECLYKLADSVPVNPQTTSKSSMTDDTTNAESAGPFHILGWQPSADPVTGLFHATIDQMIAMRARQSELQQFMSALDKSAIVTVTDLKGTILSVNDNFCSISGYSREELVGQNHRIINSGVHSTGFFRDLWRTILAGKVWTGEILNQRKDGGHYIVQSVISPMLNFAGKPERFLAVRFDVTRLRESERLLSEAQQVAKIGSWSLELCTNTFQWSPQMHQLFPAHSELLQPPTYQQYCAQIHPDDRPLWESAVANCLEDQKPFQLRFRLIQTSDHAAWLEVLCKVKLAKNGSVVALGGTCQDVTELVYAEENLRIERVKALHNAKLASLGEMSAGIAHEINNPLTIIASCAQTIARSNPSPEKVKAKIEMIEKATGRIAKIVSGLQKFSRNSDASDMKPHPLSNIVKEVITLISAEAKRYGTLVQVNLNTDAQILCDEIQIEQVLVNLINNAIDAVKTLEEKWVRIEIFEQEPYVVLQIRDSGNGIPSEHREKLFQPFFTTKIVGEGTGLGLSIVKGILEEHTATIEVLAADPNTCFEINFLKSS